jgi:hypothetical protein
MTKISCTGKISPTNQPRKASFHLYSLSPHSPQFQQSGELSRGNPSLVYFSRQLCRIPVTCPHFTLWSSHLSFLSSEFVNLLRSPGIDSQPGGPVRQPYLTYLLPGWESIPGLIKRFTNTGSVCYYSSCTSVWSQVNFRVGKKARRK